MYSLPASDSFDPEDPWLIDWNALSPTTSQEHWNSSLRFPPVHGHSRLEYRGQQQAWVPRYPKNTGLKGALTFAACHFCVCDLCPYLIWPGQPAVCHACWLKYAHHPHNVKFLSGSIILYYASEDNLVKIIFWSLYLQIFWWTNMDLVKFKTISSPESVKNFNNSSVKKPNKKGS